MLTWRNTEDQEIEKINFDNILKERHGDFARVNDTIKKFHMNPLLEKKRPLGESHFTRKHVNGTLLLKPSPRVPWRPFRRLQIILTVG